MKIFLLSITILLASTCRKASDCRRFDDDKIPACVQQKIDAYSSEAKKNPPVSIFQYCYNGKKVFYITSYCCDIPSLLIDENCNTLCQPDGGITGNGDGKCSDFFDKRSDEHLVWKDKR